MWHTSSSSLNNCRACSEQDSAPSTGELSHWMRARPASPLWPISGPTPCLRPATFSLGPAGLKTTSHKSKRSPEAPHMARRSSSTCRHTHKYIVWTTTVQHAKCENHVCASLYYYNSGFVTFAAESGSFDCKSPKTWDTHAVKCWYL